MQLSETEIKELFPEYNGDEDALEEMPGYSVGIVISGGNLIYAT